MIAAVALAEPSAKVEARPQAPSAVPRAEVPVGLAPVTVGPLELLPQKGSEKFLRNGANTCFDSYVRFRVRNVSAGDVQVVLFMSTVSITDENQEPMFKNLDDSRSMKVAGLAAAPRLGNHETPLAWMEAHKAQLTTIAPGQSVTVQLHGSELNFARVCKPDPDAEFKKTHRPRTFTFSGELGVLDLGDHAIKRAFSLEDVPLDLL
jgi:hypothetical protein